MPTAFVIDSDATRYPAARFLHLLDFYLPGAHPPDLALSIYPENHQRPDHQELTSARRRSSRHPAPFQEDKDHTDHTLDFAMTC
jgi:hypothetical protein